MSDNLTMTVPYKLPSGQEANITIDIPKDKVTRDETGKAIGGDDKFVLDAVKDRARAKYPNEFGIGGPTPKQATAPVTKEMMSRSVEPERPKGFLPNLAASTLGLIGTIPGHAQPPMVPGDPSDQGKFENNPPSLIHPVDRFNLLNKAVAHPAQEHIDPKDLPVVSDVNRLASGDFTGELGAITPQLLGGAISTSPAVRASIPGFFKGLQEGVGNLKRWGPWGLMGGAIGGAVDLMHGGYGYRGAGEGSLIGSAVGTLPPAFKGAYQAAKGAPLLNPEIMNLFRRPQPDPLQLGAPPFVMGNPHITNYPPGTAPEFGGPQYPPPELPAPEGYPMPPAGIHDITSIPTQRALPSPAGQQLNLFHDVPEFDPARTRGALPLGPEYTPRGEVTYTGRQAEPGATNTGQRIPTRPVTVKTQEEIVKQGVKDEPKGKTTEETKPPSIEDKTTEGDKGTAGPEKAKAPKAILGILSDADPSWNGEGEISYAHLKKAADSLGVSSGPFARYLIERGFEVEPSKFDPSGKYGLGRLGKKELTDDKFMSTLKKLTSE